MHDMEMIHKLRVMHVLKSSIYSGAENVVLTIMEHLKDEFDFLYVASEGPVRKALEERGIPFQLAEHFDRMHLKQIAKTFQPDIVHAHDFSATVLCALLPGKFRLISHLHYDPPWVKGWNWKTLAYRMCYSRIDKILTVSGHMFSSMVFADRCQSKQITVGNPIDGGRIRTLAEAEATSAEDIGHCDVIFVGRFVEQKNPQRFVQLIDRLRREGWTDIRAWMLGQGELVKECQELIKTLGLQGYIEIKGFQENPYVYIRRAKLLVITSRWEGFGLAAAEANILGIPVLSTDNSGCREIFGEDAPELCKTDDEFLRKMLMLHKDASAYEDWKTRSLEHAQKFDNLARYMKSMSRIYRNED